MTVRKKLLTLVVFVAIVPLAVSALTSLRVHQRAYESKLEELHRRTAEYGASMAQSFLEHTSSALRLTAGQTIRWAELSAEERMGGLWLVYQQRHELVVLGRDPEAVVAAQPRDVDGTTFLDLLVDGDGEPFSRCK